MAHIYFSFREELRDVPYWKFPVLLPFLMLNDCAKAAKRAISNIKNYEDYIVFFITLIIFWPFYLIMIFSTWLCPFVFRLLGVKYFQSDPDD